MAIPLVGALGKATAGIGKLSGVMTKMNPLLGVVGGGLELVGAALDRNAKFLNEGVEINERLLISNQTIGEFFDKNREALEQNTVGAFMSGKILTEANILGLQGNALQRRELIEAVGRMKLTGQNTKAMLDLALKTEQMTLADAKSSEMLAKSITSTAAQYGVAADKIVKAVGALDFTMQTAAGFGPGNLQEIIVGITGESQQRGDIASRVINAVSQMDLGKAIALGIETPFKQLREGSITREGFERMMDTLEDRLEFGSIAGMRPEMVQEIFGIGPALQAEIRAERQLAAEGPTRERGAIDGIAASLAAQDQRANSQTEMQAAMMKSQRIIEEASILAGGFLNNISMTTLGELKEAAIVAIADSDTYKDIKKAAQESLGIEGELSKRTEDLLNYSRQAREADEKLVNASEEGVRIQEQELHLRELADSDQARRLEDMMNARFNDNSEALLIQILDKIGEQVVVAREGVSTQQAQEADRMLTREAGDG